MRNLILLFCMLLFCSFIQGSFAGDENILSYTFGIRQDQDDFQGGKILRATLNEDKEFVIHIKTLPGNNPEKTFRKKLQDNTYQQVLNDVIELSREEILKKRHLIVCMVYPSLTMRYDDLMVARDYDDASSQFKGPLTLVDGVHGCWNPMDISPKTDFGKRTAGELKKEVRAIALEMIK